MTCPSCAAELPPDAAFCLACGARQTPLGCSSCGAELVPGAAFCMRCGTPTGSAAVQRAAPPLPREPLGAERRLTSVLFADLVSYTTLSERRDSEDVRALLSDYFEVCSTIVRRYGGTVEKFIGDAVMAVWGVPTAHEDDAERAVRAAMELVAAVPALGERLGVPDLDVRAGVVTGEVAADLGATDQGMVAGDAVNTAARVQAAAGAGEVWVDRPTQTLTSGVVTYTDVGEHLLKGKAEPVRLFQAAGVATVRGGEQRVDGLEAPLVGRDRELRMVKELFHASEESQRPQLVVLDGEAGVGKSRLGWEFEKYVDGLQRAMWWHRGRCLSYGDRVAFWALREAVRSRVGAVEEDGLPVVLAGLESLLATWALSSEEQAWIRARVGHLLGEEGGDFAREDLFAAWTRFFERLGAEDPVVLLIEDAQHADAGLVAFLEFLLAQARVSIFVVLLARPELLAERPQLGGRRTTVLRLEPLSDSAMATVVDALVDGLPAEARDALVQRAEGIPLFAVETVRALIDRDVVVPSDGRYVVGEGRTVDLADVGAPASLHALVAARLDLLPAHERAVVSAASVLGNTFTRQGIGILAADVPDLDGVLAALRGREIIATEVDPFSSERGQFRFVQAVVRQVAYATLTRRDRKARHLLVADHLSREEGHGELAQVVARHVLDALDASGESDPDVPELRDRAAKLLLASGERARSLGAPSEARRLFGQAADLLAGVRRADALQRRCLAEYDQLLLEAAVATGTEAMALYDAHGDSIGAARAAVPMLYSLVQQGGAAEAVETASARLATIEAEHGVDDVKARLLRSRAAALQYLGRAPEANDDLQEGLRLADRSGDTVAACDLLITLAVQHTIIGSSRASRILFEGAAAFARDNEYWEKVKIAEGNLAALLAADDLEQSMRRTAEVFRVSAEHGLAVPPALYMNQAAWHFAAGRWADLDPIIAAARERSGDQLGMGSAMASLVRLISWAGGQAPRWDLEDDGTDYAAPTLGLFVAAVDALVAGRPQEASDLAVRLVHTEHELNGIGDDLHVFWPVAVRFAGFRGLAEASRSTADPLRVEADLRAAIAGLGRYGGRVWQAHAQEDLGRWLVAQGRSSEAEEHLASARATYADLGASRWLARVDSAVRQH